MENSTPMLRQYHEIKSKHSDCILFFRLGDFYEMFFDDAKKASQVLDLVLTSRGHGPQGKVPMCGIPFHAADSYIARLIKAGHKVAICEQVEDPQKAKGIVKRDVIRIITAGTYIDDTASDPRYIASISIDKKGMGLAFIESTSGTIHTNEYKGSIDQITAALAKLSLHECLYPASNEDAVKEIFRRSGLSNRNVTFSPQEDWLYNTEICKKSIKEHFRVHNLMGFGIENLELAVSASGALLEYMKNMNKNSLRHIDTISLYTDSGYMFISPAAIYGLELDNFVRTIDLAVTAMGKRMFRDWMYRPLTDSKEIKLRQNAVTVLKDNSGVKKDVGNILSHIPDIEKSISRISCGIGSPKDLLALRNALLSIPEIQKAVSTITCHNAFFDVHDIPLIRQLLEKSIDPEMPVSNPDGNVIRAGYNKELDELKDIRSNGRSWLKELQEKEIKRTGINSLKIGFTSVFGYYIAVSKANLKLVPGDYIRKQTLVNEERFITPELKEFEEKMLSAEEKVFAVEKELISGIHKEILNSAEALHLLAEELARLDCLYSFSILASSDGYIAPSISDDMELVITEGKHPVVMLRQQENFIPNDTILDSDENHFLIITGPNMSGKSTYIRQTALLTIMAQAGSYIPALSAKIGIVDKVFTRIGAHDEISKGQSTFMVEMTETAGILNNLTPRSLVILDEIGRGTSTFDGLSLAWAIAEYMIKKNVRTLFATHFHELTSLSEQFKGVKNYNVSVKEWNDEIIFLHKIVQGGCDDSYGIYVAKLAGVPKEVIKRGSEILAHLEYSGNLSEKIRSPQAKKEKQMSFFTDLKVDPVTESIKKELKDIDTNTLTPIDALNKLNKWKDMVDTNG